MRRRSLLVDRPAWVVGARRVGVRLVAVGPVLALLAGCGGEDPAPTPTSSSSPTVSESTSPTTSPTQAAESAEEFIRRWVEVSNEMQTTGGTEEYRAASLGCSACSALASKIERFYADGGFVKTEGWTVLSLTRIPSSRPSRPEFNMEVRSAPTIYKESEAGDVKTFAGGLDRYHVFLKRIGGRLTMANLLEVAK